MWFLIPVIVATVATVATTLADNAAERERRDQRNERERTRRYTKRKMEEAAEKVRAGFRARADAADHELRSGTLSPKAAAELARMRDEWRRRERCGH